MLDTHQSVDLDQIEAVQRIDAGVAVEVVEANVDQAPVVIARTEESESSNRVPETALLDRSRENATKPRPKPRPAPPREKRRRKR
jgi:hypothetical protein